MLSQVSYVYRVMIDFLKKVQKYLSIWKILNSLFDETKNGSRVYNGI